jgi:hypothetical protein
MQHCENLISNLDQFSTAVYLKDVNGRHISMNKIGIEVMKGNHGRVLGKTTYELFDLESAKKMTHNDQCVMRSGKTHTSEFTALDRISGDRIHLFNAKTAIFSPSGLPLGVVGISIVNCNDLPLYADVCRLLPHFVQRKQPHLLHELLELQTVSEFFKAYRLH